MTTLLKTLRTKLNAAKTDLLQAERNGTDPETLAHLEQHFMLLQEELHDAERESWDPADRL